MNSVLNFFTTIMFVTDMFLINGLASIHLPRRDHFSLRFLGMAVVCMTAAYAEPQILNLFLDHNYPRCVIDCLAQFTLVMLAIPVCFRVSVWNALFINSFSFYVQQSALMLDRVLRGEMAISATVYFQHYLFIAIVFILAWTLYWRRVSSTVLEKLERNLILPLVVITLLVCVCINQYVTMIEQLTFSFHLMDLVCNFLGMCCQYSVLSITALKTDKTLLEEMLRQSEMQYQISKQNMELINIKCHDLRHQIHRLRTNSTLNEKAITEMEHTIDEYDCVIRIGNPALDVILTEKNLLCRQKGIEFTCMADGSRLPEMDECDIYSLFGNVLDNAIEAVENCQDPEMRFISLTMSVVNSFLSVSISNYADKVVVFDKGLPQTHKEDKFNHGFGVRSIQMLTEKYGGEASFAQEDNVFSTNIVLPCRADCRTPLEVS